VIDPATGRPILVAPARQRRPILTDDGHAQARCPFCPGHEDDTPPVLGALRGDGTATQGSDWVARAFANLYPAGLHHEVIAEGPVHSQVPADLDARQWAVALELAADRMRVMEQHPEVGCAFWFKNVGRMAGASIAHNHSQILGLPEPPPRLRDEARLIGPDSPNPQFMARQIAQAKAEGRHVSGGAFPAFSPQHPKLPFEVWIAPVDPAVDFCDLTPAARLELGASVRRVFSALHTAFDGAPFNAWLHRLPGTGFHWHLEVQPRTGFLAGLELGGDMYINAVPAIEAAQRLRSALA